MSQVATNRVLTEALWEAEGAALLAKRAALVAGGVALLTISAQIRVPVWPSPVLMNLGTLGVLTVAAAYGPRLGLVTMLAWMLVGALGFDVFQSSTAEYGGLAYMAGPTGGYLLGYVLATLALGYAARRGWDRGVWTMAAALLVGNALIYVPGLLWLGHLVASGMFDPTAYASIWEQTIAWGLTPFLVGDALKLAIAALLLPVLWKLLGRARG